MLRPGYKVEIVKMGGIVRDHPVAVSLVGRCAQFRRKDGQRHMPHLMLHNPLVKRPEILGAKSQIDDKHSHNVDSQLITGQNTLYIVVYIRVLLITLQVAILNRLKSHKNIV